jgi:hypothetical protein
MQYQRTINEIQGTRVRAGTASLALDAQGRVLRSIPEPKQSTLNVHFGLTQPHTSVGSEDVRSARMCALEILSNEMTRRTRHHSQARQYG